MQPLLLDSTFSPDQPVTITFAALESDRTQYEPLIAAFNADQPGIRVQFVALDQALELDRGFDPERIMRSTAQLADTAADIVVGTRAQRRRYMHDLAPFIDADPTFDQADFYQGALQRDPEDSSIRLLPSTIAVPVMAYNKAVFATRGAGVPTPDWTWNDRSIITGFTRRLTLQCKGRI